jgi:hypothetical protein
MQTRFKKKMSRITEARWLITEHALGLTRFPACR